MNILLVEDDELLRETLSYELELEGYEITCAQNGLEAIDLVGKHIYDIIISDVKMPKLDGRKLLETIRAKYEKLPLMIMMSGFSDLSEKEAVSLGAETMLSKPIQSEKLFGIINSLKEKVEAYKNQ